MVRCFTAVFNGRSRETCEQIVPTGSERPASEIKKTLRGN